VEHDARPDGATDQGPPRRRRLGVVASAAFSLLLVASLYVLFPIGALIAPLGMIPVLHAQAGGRHGVFVWGPVVGLLMVAGVAGFGAVALPVLAAYMLVVVVPSAGIDLWPRAKWTEGRWAAVSVVAGLVLSLAAFAGAAWPQAPQAAALDWLRTGVEQSLEQTPEALAGVGEVQLDLMERVGSWILPSLPVAYLVAVLFWIRPRLPLLGFRLPVGPFEAYRSDEWLPAAFAAAGGATLLLDGTPRWVALNALVAVLALYFVHGLAIIRAHLARFVGRRWFVRWGVTLLCLWGPLPPIVSMLGLTDSFWDLRRRAEDDGGQ
jgi:hypothetical protein